MCGLLSRAFAIAAATQRANVKRGDARYQLHKLQTGEQSDNFKPAPTMGRGVEQIRIWTDEGTFRLLYVARLAEAVYLLHAFSKKEAGHPARGPGARAKPVARTKVERRTKPSRDLRQRLDAISGSAQQSAKLTARAQVMRTLQALVKEAGWTQAEAVESLGVSQRLSKFSLDALANRVSAAGRLVQVQVEVVKKSLAPHERLRGNRVNQSGFVALSTEEVRRPP